MNEACTVVNRFMVLLKREGLAFVEKRARVRGTPSCRGVHSFVCVFVPQEDSSGVHGMGAPTNPFPAGPCDGPHCGLARGDSPVARNRPWIGLDWIGLD